MADSKKESRRPRKGHSEETRPVRKSSKQLDPEAFAAVDQMIGALAHKSFGKVLPAVMAGFFGASNKDELKNPELQAAFMMFFVYGWKDPHGMRIVDVFASYGPQLHDEQARVLSALRQARLALFEVQRREPGNKQLHGREVFRDSPMSVLDHNAYEALADHDALLAWYIPVGDFWRPFGVATHVEADKLAALTAALIQLADDLGVTVAELPQRKAAQAFWVVFRAANAELR
jgi:hypothetical protein